MGMQFHKDAAPTALDRRRATAAQSRIEIVLDKKEDRKYG